MGIPLRVLIVEDSEANASQLLRELRSGGYDPISERVDTAATMQAMLRRQEWDCVISDISMPSFSATAALELLKTSGIDLPFILVLGTVGEHTAVATMRAGTRDLMIKQNLTRLIPVVERELHEATVRREQKRIEKSILESEERYRMLVETASDGIFIQCDGKFIFVNSAGLGILGATSAEQVTNKPVYDFIHPEFREIAREHIRQLEEEGKKVPLHEEKILRHDGSTVEVEVTAVPFVFQGKPAAHLIMRDITDRKITERRLAWEHAMTRVLAESPTLSQAASEEKLSGILGSIDNVIWSISASTYETLYLNPAAEKLYGMPVTEFYKNKDLWLSMVHPEDRKRVGE
ncbi:MAG TPA: PAS domain S-box protein, partial [Burkholderiales bacterium]|nr:PAS domain S-box protein [Burkholderiales bacterium]